MAGEPTVRSRGLLIAAAVVFAVLVFAAAAAGGLSVDNTQGEYLGLTRPSWAPPGWVFGPVWSVLYVMIATAGWLVYRQVGLSRALIPWGIQLLLNAAWTPIFFGLGLISWALVDIVALWVVIVITIAVFWRISRWAALLFVPYLLWVSFATALNAAIVVLNAG